MQLKTLVPLVLAGLTSAQTPAGFVPKVDAHLNLIFGTKVVSPPGTALTRAGEFRIPSQLSFKDAAR
jgi:phosphatidylethanolamine-binding protein